MAEMTKMQLDRTVYESLIPFVPQGIAFLNEHNIAPCGKSTWEKRARMRGFPMHRPNGGKGKRYIVPKEVDDFLRSRCTDNDPGQNARP
jgi:hypothetical protein